jgi:hypothetical protein
VPKLRPLVTIALMTAIVSACGWQESPRLSPPSSPVPSSTPSLEAPGTPSTEPVSAIVTIETRGGECPGGPCGSVVAIEADGRVHQLQPTDEVIGQVPPEILEALRVEIDQANFSLIESRPFTDLCPTAYDGQETIYVFSVGLGTSFERIASCEVLVDPAAPLFVAVSAALAGAAAR